MTRLGRSVSETQIMREVRGERYLLTVVSLFCSSLACTTPATVSNREKAFRENIIRDLELSSSEGVMKPEESLTSISVLVECC